MKRCITALALAVASWPGECRLKVAQPVAPSTAGYLSDWGRSPKPPRSLDVPKKVRQDYEPPDMYPMKSTDEGEDEKATREQLMRDTRPGAVPRANWLNSVAKSVEIAEEKAKKKEEKCPRPCGQLQICMYERCVWRPWVHYNLPRKSCKADPKLPGISSSMARSCIDFGKASKEMCSKSGGWCIWTDDHPEWYEPYIPEHPPYYPGRVWVEPPKGTNYGYESKQGRAEYDPAGDVQQGIFEGMKYNMPGNPSLSHAFQYHPEQDWPNGKPGWFEEGRMGPPPQGADLAYKGYPVEGWGR
eukprot:gnl/TRDRNA2_/TRDRNA2_180838_c0_seq1.p1 gnl/TRDRNA2_/TRDRNA2_180838_c0~~gnl/TRDRNA2_/TRDRNA2_180838_c0_seq1.p1  ORF type:complete len:300 (+),score=45.12 gnl/TRDRNA2_/TRDRNA2_180838_c0_seq1:97-996(+)